MKQICDEQFCIKIGVSVSSHTLAMPMVIFLWLLIVMKCLLFVLQNIVQATNSVLNPVYVDQWNQIASSTGKGVENVMEVYEDYLNVLMQNFVDTFTRPFEVVEKNIGIILISIHINKYKEYYIVYVI